MYGITKVYNLNDPNAYISVVRKNQGQQDLHPKYNQKLYNSSLTPTMNSLFEGLYIQPFQAPVNPPVNPPINPPVNPPVDPPVNPPVDPPVNPPVDPPVQPPVNPPVDPPVQPPVDPPVNPPVNPPVDPPVDPPVQPPVDPPVQPPVEPPVNPFADESALTRAWGDPHFELNFNGTKKQAFDFQGKAGNVYSVLNNDDFALNAKFDKSSIGNAMFITDQNLELKGTGINIVSHKGGQYEIYNNGAQVNANDPALQQAGATVNYANSVLTVNYKGRTITQKLESREIEDKIAVKYGDTGLLSQLVGAVDNDENKNDGITHFQYDINKDGKVDENDVLHYDVASQTMVQSDQSGLAAPVIYSLNDKADILAKDFVNAAGKSSSSIDEAFEGSFEGAGNITSSSDSKLIVNPTDSAGVAAAKRAMKSLLLYKECKSEAKKLAATEAVTTWITAGSNELHSDINNINDSYAGKFSEYSGYSRSQWNEYMGNMYIKQDNYLA